MAQSSAYRLAVYEPSGRCPLIGALLTLLLGVVAALVLAPVYSFVTFHNPSAWLGVLAPVGYGWLVVMVLSWSIRRFGICSPSRVVLIALVSMAAGYWLHWYSYAAVVFAQMEDDPWNVVAILRETLDMICYDPTGAGLWGFIQEINEVGLWTFGNSRNGMAVNGPILWLVWFGEFLILLGVVPFKLWKVAGEPWSEVLERHMPANEMPCVIPWQDAEELRSQLSRGDVSALCETVADDEEENAKEERYATVTIYEDPRTPCVSVTNVKKHKKKEKKTSVVQYACITPEAASQIQEALSLRSM